MSSDTVNGLPKFDSWHGAEKSKYVLLGSVRLGFVLFSLVRLCYVKLSSVKLIPQWHTSKFKSSSGTLQLCKNKQ